MIRLRRPARDVAVWLLIGLAVREAFSFWTGHPFDSEIWVRNAYYVAHGWNPYVDMPPVPGLSFAYPGGAIPSVAYLPLWPLILAGLYQAFTPFAWAGRFLLYFLIKQPTILGDMAVGVLLFAAAMRWGAARPVARRILAFWMLFPYPILVSAVWGQFDAIVAALVLGSLLVAASWKRSGLLGLGILLKSFPIIFVPYELIRAGGQRRWIALLAVAVPATFTAAVFAVTGWGLAGFSGTLSWEAHGAPQGMTIGALLVDPSLAGLVAANLEWITLLGYLWIPGVAVGAWWIARRFPQPDAQAVLQAYMFLTVLLFLLRWVVNEQYVVYLLPLLLLDAALWHPERRGLFHATWILALSFLVVNNFFLVRFAAPAFPAALSFEAGLAANGAFSAARTLVLEILGILFTVHLLQVGMVIANPKRSATPWLVLGLRRTWSASLRRVRAMAAGRGG